MTYKEMIKTINSIMKQVENDYAKQIVVKNSINKHCRGFKKEFGLDDLSDEIFKEILDIETGITASELLAAVKKDLAAYMMKNEIIELLNNNKLCVDYVANIRLLKFDELSLRQLNLLSDDRKEFDSVYIIDTINPNYEVIIEQDNIMFDTRYFDWENFPFQLKTHIKYAGNIIKEKKDDKQEVAEQ